MKWVHKMSISFSTFHNDTMVTFQERKICKPGGIKNNSLYVGRVDLKNQKL
jgi:hypothetical protein